MERDKQLDIYRGLSIIYVVCITHVLFWLQIGQEPWLSFALIEMPIIFFISGAALSVSKTSKSLVKTIFSRFKRVVVPFYIYAIGMIGVICILTILRYECYDSLISLFDKELIDKSLADITTYGLDDLVNILCCKGIAQSPCSWHLWFILPYLIISCTFGIQQKMLTYINNRLAYVLLCVIVWLLSLYVIKVYMISLVLGFNLFMVIGYCYYKRCSFLHILIIGCGSLFVVLGLLLYGVFFYPMQNHKFPPDLMFVAYNLFVLCLFSVILKYIKLPRWKMFDIWNQRGYTIYLYQNIAFFIYFPIHKVVILRIDYNVVQFIIGAISLFVISTLISSISYPIERYVMKKINLV